jgi:hypothetical protein
VTARQATCRDCGEPIIFAAGPNGRPLPYDKDPDPASLHALSRDLTLTLHARVLRPGEERKPGEHRHQLHFDTCPQRARKGNQ